MHWKRASKFRLAILIAGLLAAGAIVWWRLPEPPPPYREVITQQPGEPPVVWRPMRVRWSFKPIIAGHHEYISDLVESGGNLVYASDFEIGCVNKKTGRLVWRSPMATKQEVAAGANGRSARPWRVFADSKRIYAVQSEHFPDFGFSRLSGKFAVRSMFVSGAGFGTPSGAATSVVRALDRTTGLVVWEETLPHPYVTAAVQAGDMIVLPSEDGALTALRSLDGIIAWQRGTRPRKPNQVFDVPRIRVGYDRGVIMAAAGERLEALRPGDGSLLWAEPSAGKKAADAEESALKEFAVSDGVVFAVNSGSLAATEITTGRRKWVRKLDFMRSNNAGILADKERVFLIVNGTAACLRKTDGATVWYYKLPEAWGGYLNGTLEQMGGKDTLWGLTQSGLLAGTTPLPPLIHGVERKPICTGDVQTVIVLDSQTGKERWRWQPEDGVSFGSPIVDRDRLYVSTYDRIVAYERGMPPPLPRSRGERSDLAVKMVRAICAWPPERESLTDRMRKWLPRLLGWMSAPNQPDTIDEATARLTLLRLGRDSAEPLLAFLRERVRAGKPITGNTGNSHIRFGRMERVDVTDPLDILVDLDDPSVTPELVRLVRSSREPAVRRVLAEALIQLADARAIPALWEIAESDLNGGEIREDALHFLCRAEDMAPPGSAGLFPKRDEVTAFLTKALRNESAPAWLRNFARCELLNDRGKAARDLALVSFSTVKSTIVMSPNPIMARNRGDSGGSGGGPGFPTTFDAQATAVDERGTHWAAFSCPYLGNYIGHLWFVQSRDCKRWTRPAFALDLSSLCSANAYPDKYKLRCRGGVLELKWNEDIYRNDGEIIRSVKHVNRFPVDSLYRDSDGDGLSDRMEAQLGTDPLRADSNGNGIPDNSDPNSLYRPHPRSEQEEIYETVLEALCQVEQGTPKAGAPPTRARAQPRFGDSLTPIILPLPPGSSGIKVNGCLSSIFFCNPPARIGKRPTISEVQWTSKLSFKRPIVSFEGVGREDDDDSWHPPKGDPFTQTQQSWDAPYSFARFFPVQRSSDGQRIRIGCEITGSDQGKIDVLLRRIGGHWLAVECRLISTDRGDRSVAALPLRPMRWSGGVKGVGGVVGVRGVRGVTD